ncbi:hypothetical protein SAICODRAFT_59162 [Saitoella complicata NRRL Y-17804]|uniref:MIF4G domain-containing protein n=1 Tax=Saitoella complicata (strain BCRC 22490 / CBS 7301 / JCM 7358 / NBRC 10748 / NRRL Y-17804) TaxID=698492 RepID=A0A0E9NFN8_SAICN|nr:uncharacterized protein SAICODRAFT_59162 [Saitoella complicata NRRL Y-17804]ODQ51928.1 hypothetical protein SAICODRAFT_59162 [Saitoella complicata NRRL Y-17804]GAO48682.1 hypothetical protein G7K_2852-t1 [Saitoella complicata NRRL Y-17804]
MGDYNRRGGGGRKRYRDDNDDDDYYRRQRPSAAEASLGKIRRELVGLADPHPNARLDEDISYIAKVIAGELDQVEFRTGFLEVLKGCILELPFKIPHFASVVVVANARYSVVGQTVLEYILPALQKSIDSGEWSKVKLLLRFLAQCGQMIDGRGITEVLENMAALVEKGPRSTYFDELASIILLTIPYAASALNFTGEQHPEVQSILDKLTPYFNSRSVDFSLNCHYLVDEAPYTQTESLVLLWQQITEQQKTGWNLAYLPNPQSRFISELEAGKKHPLGEINFPEASEKATYIPEPHLQIFISQEIQSVPSSTDLASCLLRDVVYDGVDALEFNRKEGSRYLADMDAYFPFGAFAPRAIPYDKLGEDPSPSKWKCEDIVVEGILARMLRLPSPPCRAVYYQALLIEMCKYAPGAIAPVMGRAVRFLYADLDKFDAEVVYRFYDWLSVHFSNFQFMWRWDDWAGDLGLDDLHPKKVFVKELLEKEIRLSYHARIKGTLPEAFVEVIGAEQATPEFKYADNEDVKVLLEMIRTKKPADEIETQLKKVEDKAEGTEQEKARKAQHVLVQCVLQLGEKSFSHALNTFERSLPVLLARCASSTEARRFTVGCVMEYWAPQPSIGATLLDKLLNYTVLNPLAVVEWFFTEGDVELACRSHAWEALETTLDKVNNRVIQVRERAEQARAAGLSEEDESKMQATLDNVHAEQADVWRTIFRSYTSFVERAGRAEDGASEERVQWRVKWAKGWYKAVVRRYFEAEKELKGVLDSVVQEAGEEAKDLYEKAISL